MFMVYSPAPTVGAIVLAIVLGIPIPVAAWSLLGVRMTS
jgi:hypothetical protein